MKLRNLICLAALTLQSIVFADRNLSHPLFCPYNNLWYPIMAIDLGHDLEHKGLTEAAIHQYKYVINHRPAEKLVELAKNSINRCKSNIPTGFIQIKSKCQNCYALVPKRLVFNYLFIEKFLKQNTNYKHQISPSGSILVGNSQPCVCKNDAICMWYAALQNRREDFLPDMSFYTKLKEALEQAKHDPFPVVETVLSFDVQLTCGLTTDLKNSLQFRPCVMNNQFSKQLVNDFVKLCRVGFNYNKHLDNEPNTTSDTLLEQLPLGSSICILNSGIAEINEEVFAHLNKVRQEQIFLSQGKLIIYKDTDTHEMLKEMFDDSYKISTVSLMKRWAIRPREMCFGTVSSYWKEFDIQFYLHYTAANL